MVNFYSEKNKQEVELTDKAKSARVASAKITKSKIDTYIDPTGEFETKELRRSFWYVRNKLVLYRIAVACLIIISASTVIFALWRGAEILYYDLFRGAQVDYELRQTTDYRDFNQLKAPMPLQIIFTSVFSTNEGKVDIVSEIANPNARQQVSFDYYYDFGGMVTKRQQAIISPMDNQVIANLGLDSSIYTGSPNLVIENVRWKRLDNHRYPDLEAWLAERNNFTLENFTFANAGTDLAVGQALRFRITNNSTFNYREPLFYLQLFQNGSLVGVVQFGLIDFMTGDSREIDLRLYANNLAIDEVKLFPVIDFFNQSVYVLPNK